ncbi:MAG TPA: 4-hydroxy-tetrahydrodipicolinate reductase [Nevskiaceae bacterium]
MSSTALRIAIMGATGRMGAALLEGVLTQPDLALVAALTRADDPLLGADAAAHIGRAAGGVPFSSGIAEAVRPADVIVDFSRPEATLELVAACRQARKPLVTGTTGLDAAGQRQIDALARKVAVCQAANFSVGVTVCLGLLETATRILGPEYDVEIVEAHHRHKVDAPSGTALMMGRAVAAARGQDLERVAVFERHGRPGARDSAAIGFSAVRGGDVVGDHTVMFLGEGERVEITHRAGSRANFARGALRAARWLAGKPSGRYDMRDVLGLR